MLKVSSAWLRHHPLQGLLLLQVLLEYMQAISDEAGNM
jgi:hypothetical protein